MRFNCPVFPTLLEAGLFVAIVISFVGIGSAIVSGAVALISRQLNARRVYGILIVCNEMCLAPSVPPNTASALTYQHQEHIHIDRIVYIGE